MAEAAAAGFGVDMGVCAEAQPQSMASATSHVVPQLRSALDKSDAYFAQALTCELTPAALAQLHELKQDALAEIGRVSEAVDASGFAGLVVDAELQLMTNAELNSLDASRHRVHLNALAAVQAFQAPALSRPKGAD
jgi:hypothetical protein